jgi:PAS domain S-box-containing protein
VPRKALRESEYKLRQIIESAVPGMLWVTGPDGEVTRVNQRTLDFTGARSVEDLLNLGWKKFLHPEDFPKTANSFFQAIQTGESYEDLQRVRRVDGEYRWHHVRAEPLRDREGRIIEWYGLSVDIDEGKKIEERLRRSEAYLAEAQRLTHTATAAYDATKILYFSDEAFRLFGFDPLQGLPSREAVWQRIHPDDVDTMNEKIERALRERRSFQNEFRLKLPDGTVKHVDADILPVFSATGKLVEIIATAVDVTERKRAEDTLRRGEAWLAQAQRLSHSGTWVLDGTTRHFLYWSDESYRIWGFDPLQGLPSRDDMWERIHPDDRERLWGEVQEALREQRDFFEEFRILLPDGTVKYLEANTHHEFSPLGVLLEVVCTNVDVTERKRAQDERERLRQLEADLAHINRVSTMGELAASLSHEILHPIATARNNARAGMRFLELNPPNLNEVREALGCVVRDADRAKDIVGRIRNQIKRAPPRIELFGLNEAVSEVIVMVRSAIAKNGISVSTRLMDGLAPVQGDRVQLQQVLVNLILNAVEAMSSVEDGTRELLIRTEQSQTGGILVAVHDSGLGVDPVNLERVFEPFYTTKTSGIGMGLSICQTIIHTHGGRLWMRANEPRGAVFQFILPAAQEDL